MTTQPFDSDEYDRQIRRLRGKARPFRPKEEPGTTRTAAYGPARGWATPEELRRREEARVMIASGLMKQAAAAKPRQVKNGPWVAKGWHDGQRHHRTFDTKQEAEQYIDKIKGGQ